MKAILRRVLLLSIFFLFLTSSITASAANLYKDINKSYWAYSSIEWATKKGIMAGFPDGTFKPTKAMTESQLISVLTKLDSSYKRVSPYVAKKGEASSAGYYRYFKSKQIPLAGLSDSKQRNKPVTRGQFAKIIAAADGYKLTEKYAVEYLYSQGLSNGTSGKKTYEDFQPKRNLTRADAIVLLQRLENRGNYKIVGVKNGNVADVPADFPDSGTIVFPSPSRPSPTNPPSTGTDSRVAGVDIEKLSLIANGVDSTFITISLKDCYGNPISYDQSIPLVVRSALGASITTDYGGKVNSAITLYSDGPDITAKITAIKSNKAVTDTISFTISEGNYTGVNMSCYKNPINVKVTYEPKAELRIEHEVFSWGNNYQEQSVQVKATIVRPGGDVITDYNGKIRFTSSQLNFTSNEVQFINGVASTTAPNTRHRGFGQFTATVTQADPRYSAIVGEVTNRPQTQEVYLEQPLTVNYSCPRNYEIGFIIDSSGSMKRNDPNRLRVAKSQEMITKLGATYNVGTHFNSSGHLLATGNQFTVSSSFYNVTQSGGTNIAAGLDIALDRFSNNQTLKVAILLTDGKSSTNRLVSLLQKARDRNVTIYTIGLGSKSQLNEEFLDQLATTTGGSYFHVEDSRDITAAYQTIINEVNCDTPPPSCSYYNQGFVSPTIRLTSSSLYMNTFMDNNCGTPAKVIVRFTSLEGNIDYELIDRGQNYFAIEKGSYEIANLSLISEGKFIAYDAYGNVIGEKIVTITN